MKIIKFFIDNDFKTITIATILSRMITELVYSFIDNLLYPIFKVDLNNDGKPDVNNYINKTTTIFNINFKFGKFIIDFAKFIIVLYVVYLIGSNIK